MRCYCGFVSSRCVLCYKLLALAPDAPQIHSVNGKPSGMVEDFEKVKAAEFDALIPPHGRVIKTGAKQAFLDSQKVINWK